MRRIQLQIYAHPGAADITCNLKRADGSYLRLTATIDTGAVVSLFPKIVLDEIAHRATGNEIEIEQAGIAQQVFKVQQGYITLFSRTHRVIKLKILRFWHGLRTLNML